ncbi:HEAT repeat domain-containing protein [Myxococcus sp. CA056]|uniref:HEAT repeat domain-containing protein n=3 Tax=Myxococcus TaxID=32 RepID=UPI00157B41BC|nr:MULTISPECIES: HEAT repeat domain-containing protein [unclassified Myxococcus]NTX16734.1 HEAT repeat domain-containing protein [Myxococcus sp. CA056]NTX41194.1 HEAT repeat domain-containing protein [Myxococcus sp. CA033]
MSHLPVFPAEEERYRALQELDPRGEGILDVLLTGLHDESWRVRHAAAEGLQRLAAPEDVALRLVGVLGERGETGARNAAAEALVGLGLPALRPLVKLLGHADPDQRKFAADILGQLGLHVAEAPLVQALEDPDLNVRVAVSEALGRVGSEHGARALERLLGDPEPLLRLSALEGLVLLRRPPPLPVVVALLDDARLRRSAFRALGLIPQVAATERLCLGLESATRSVREAALAALGTQASLVEPARRCELEAVIRAALRRLPDAVARLAQALESEDVTVRAGALLAVAALGEASLAVPVAEAAREDRLLRDVLSTLGRLGAEGGRTLLAAMSDLSAPARAAAAEALVDLVDATSVTPLCALLEWAEDDLRGVVVRALGRTRSSEAAGPLVDLLRDSVTAGAATRALGVLAGSCRGAVLAALEDAVARRATPVAVAALGRVGGAPALPSLRKLARDVDPRWRAAAVEVAGEVDGGVGRELARAALADEAAPVRAAGARAMGRLGGTEAGALLRSALQDEESSVRRAAVEAVGESGAMDRVTELEPLVRHPDGALAVAAVRALSRLGRVGERVLREASGHPDAEVVKAVLSAGAVSREGVSLAVSLLEHPHWDVRAAAARVLGDSGGPECLGPTQRALEAESDVLARQALSDAVERLARR